MAAPPPALADALKMLRIEAGRLQTAEASKE